MNKNNSFLLEDIRPEDNTVLSLILPDSVQSDRDQKNYYKMYFGYTLNEVNKWCVLYCSQPLLWQQHRGPSSSSYFSVQNSIGKAQRETHHLHKTYLATATKPTKLLPD